MLRSHERVSRTVTLSLFANNFNNLIITRIERNYIVASHNTKMLLTVALLLAILHCTSMAFGVKLEDMESFRCETSRKPNKNSKCWKYENEDKNVSIYAYIGDRKTMEDRIYFENNIDDTGISIYAVFDGHAGDMSAQYVAEHLTNDLKSKLISIKNQQLDETIKTYYQIDYKKTLREVIKDTDEKLLNKLNEKRDPSGTTATIAVMYDELLYIANVGDSRAVMSDENGVALRLSIDHRPDNPKEERRIIKAGGRVTQGASGTYRVDGVGVSRALGDKDEKPLKRIIAKPDVFVYDLSRYGTKFIILATDGLWDVMTDEDAVEYIKSRLEKPFFGADEIAKEAYNKNSKDNITVIVAKIAYKEHE